MVAFVHVVFVVLVAFCSSAYLVAGVPPIVSAKHCPKGCRDDSDCSLNAVCTYVDENGKGCGYCVCPEGYKQLGKKCNEVKGYWTTNSPTVKVTTVSYATSGPVVAADKKSVDWRSVDTTTSVTETTVTDTTITTTTPTPTTPTTTQSTTTGTTGQPARPPPAEPVDCGGYDCQPTYSIQTTGGNDDDPLKVRNGLINTSQSNMNSGCKRQLVIQPRPCQMIGGGSCFGVYCLNVSPGKDYCICPPYKVDRQCAVDKPGQCGGASGQSSVSGASPLQGQRYVNKNEPDNGSIYGRHFASSVSDCIKLCQWAKGSCRSVNYGQINGANVCELLSVSANKTNILASWIVSSPGWTYCQVST